MTKDAILIISSPDDPHARAVSLALSKYNANVVLKDTKKNSSLDDFAFELSAGGAADTDHSSISFKSIWLRRPLVAPWAEFSTATPAIQEIEQKYHRDATIEWLSSTTQLCVNRLPEALRAESKLVSLLEARKCGFLTPTTPFSAKPKEIKKFCEELPGRSIYKPHRQHLVGNGRMLGSTLVTQEHLKKVTNISTAPGIYQEFIDANIELRVLVTGRTITAISVPRRSDQVDSRLSINNGGAKLFSMSSILSERCISLVRTLGLTSASLDLLLTRNDEVFAIDVNPSGQFAWMEQICPDACVIDTFARFLMSGDFEFEMPADQKGRSFTLRGMTI